LYRRHASDNCILSNSAWVAVGHSRYLNVFRTTVLILEAESTPAFLLYLLPVPTTMLEEVTGDAEVRRALLAAALTPCQWLTGLPVA
jgi:hypothetical protein